MFTSRWIRNRRRAVLSSAAVAALAAGAAVGVPATASSAAQDAAAPTTTTVARTVLKDTKAVLTATRTRHLTATVRLTVYTRAGGAWHSAGTRVVGQPRGWFWNVVSGPHAVCRFSVSDTPRQAVGVRLLVTPSIGCAATSRFHVQGGRLVSD